MTLKILTYVLEDDDWFLQIIEGLLIKSEIVNYKLFSNPADFFEEFNENVHVCIVDFRLPGGMDGLGVVEKVLRLNERCKVIVISGLENPNVVIDFLNAGAFKYIRKNDPLFNEKVIKYLQQALENVKRDLIFYNSLKDKLNPETREYKKRP